MKKTLIIIIAIFGIYSINFSTYAKNDTIEKTIVIDKVNLAENTIYCDNECPDDDCFSGCLYSTYKTEYCVGAKCRDRTLYECNLNASHKYWIYHD